MVINQSHPLNWHFFDPFGKLFPLNIHRKLKASRVCSDSVICSRVRHIMVHVHRHPAVTVAALCALICCVPLFSNFKPVEMHGWLCRDIPKR